MDEAIDRYGLRIFVIVDRHPISLDADYAVQPTCLRLVLVESLSFHGFRRGAGYCYQV